MHSFLLILFIAMTRLAVMHKMNADTLPRSPPVRRHTKLSYYQEPLAPCPNDRHDLPQIALRNYLP